MALTFDEHGTRVCLARQDGGWTLTIEHPVVETAAELPPGPWGRFLWGAWLFEEGACPGACVEHSFTDETLACLIAGLRAHRHVYIRPDGSHNDTPGLHPDKDLFPWRLLCPRPLKAGEAAREDGRPRHTDVQLYDEYGHVMVIDRSLDDLSGRESLTRKYGIITRAGADRICVWYEQRHARPGLDASLHGPRAIEMGPVTAVARTRVTATATGGWGR